MNIRGLLAPAAVVTLALLGGCGAASPPTDTQPTSRSQPPSSLAEPPLASPNPASTRAAGLRVQPISALPPQVEQTWALILGGGPYPYSRDGVVFQNRERILPMRPRGYYHEYTVPTPGRSDRGARRLVTGERTDELYYTPDHYRSFVVVDVTR